jgi:co-chaperonin GroES (HSP10)
MELLKAEVLVKVEKLINDKIGDFVMPLGDTSIQTSDGRIVYNPEVHKMNYGIVVAAPKQIKHKETIKYLPEGFPEPQEYRSAEDLYNYSKTGEVIEHRFRESTLYTFTRKKVLSDAYNIEVFIGDKVYFNTQSLNSYNLVAKNVFRVKFRDTICKETNGEIYPLHGYVLCKPIKEDVVLVNGVEYPTYGKIKNGIVTELGQKNKVQTARVAYLPKPMQGQEIELVKDDVILFTRNSDYEFKINNEIYYPIQYDDIIGKY